MEGPTPVSALLHSATLVTAGVVVCVKVSEVWIDSSCICFLLCALGSVTSLFSGCCACLYLDLKRVVAYSTCLHVGLLVACLGVGELGVCWEHLFYHGWVKCGLFLTCGLLLHGLNGNTSSQDLRSSGGSAWVGLSSLFFVCVTGLSVMGLPGSFVSDTKDVILGSV